MAQTNKNRLPSVGPTNHYRFALRTARHDLADLKVRLEAIKEEEALLESRIKLVEETVRSLEPLCEDESAESDPGLTEACRLILAEPEEDELGEKIGRPFLTVPEIKKRIEHRGVYLGSYKNVLAVLHTTLNRMVANGELDTNGKKGKRTFWKK